MKADWQFSVSEQSTAWVGEDTLFCTSFPPLELISWTVSFQDSYLKGREENMAKLKQPKKLSGIKGLKHRRSSFL